MTYNHEHEISLLNNEVKHYKLQHAINEQALNHLNKECEELKEEVERTKDERRFLFVGFQNERKHKQDFTKRLHAELVQELQWELDQKDKEIVRLKTLHQHAVLQWVADLRAEPIEPVEIPLEPIVKQLHQQDSAIEAAAKEYAQMEQDAFDVAIAEAVEEFARNEQEKQDTEVDVAIAEAAEGIARIERETESMDIVNARPAAKPVAVVAPLKQEQTQQEAEPSAFNDTELRQGWYIAEEGDVRIIPFQHGFRPAFYEWDMNTQPFS